MLNEIIERRRVYVESNGFEPKRIRMTPAQFKELQSDVNLTTAKGGGYLFYVCGMEIIKCSVGLELAR